jgi:general secretion pathway protein C
MVSRVVLEGCFSTGVLCLLGATAYFQASAVNRLIIGEFGNELSVPRVLPKPAARPSPRVSAAPVLARNPFDSLTGALTGTPARSLNEPGDPLGVPQCDGAQLYIVSESKQKQWSMATLRGAGEATPHARRVGDTVESKRVEYIGFNPRHSTPAVWLSGERGLCQTLLFSSKSASFVGARLPEQSLTRPVDPAERLRVVPELVAGKLLGVRLFGIRPNGVFAAIGLQNGDRLESINGLQMNSPERALQLYATLRSTSDFDLHLARGRERRPVALRLHLR